MELLPSNHCSVKDWLKNLPGSFCYVDDSLVERRRGKNGKIIGHNFHHGPYGIVEKVIFDSYFNSEQYYPEIHFKIPAKNADQKHKTVSAFLPISGCKNESTTVNNIVDNLSCLSPTHKSLEISLKGEDQLSRFVVFPGINEFNCGKLWGLKDAKIKLIEDDEQKRFPHVIANIIYSYDDPYPLEESLERWDGYVPDKPINPPVNIHILKKKKVTGNKKNVGYSRARQIKKITALGATHLPVKSFIVDGAARNSV